MLKKAIEKINIEIESSKNNPYIQVVGGFLLQHIQDNPNNAEKIVQDGKTIAKSLDEMKKAAEKKKVGNCAVLTDQEGFGIVLKYFGIEGAAPINIQKPVDVIQVPTPPIVKEKKPSIDFNVECDF